MEPNSGIYIEYVTALGEVEKKFFVSTQYAINWGKRNVGGYNYNLIKYQKNQQSKILNQK
jgi:hypothetical protein